MNVAFDYDGVVTANWNHYFQLAFDLSRSGHVIYIITAANRDRADMISRKLDSLCFSYHQVIKRPQNFESTLKNIGEWKKQMIKDNDIDLWFDNEIKVYEQAGVRFDDLGIDIVRI